VITYRATVDVPRELVWFVARLLLAERRRRGDTGRQPGADLLLAGGAGAALTGSATAQCRMRLEPGSVYDITAARLHALPALYRAAAAGLLTLADPGYEGAGLGILIPVKQPPSGGELDIDTRTRNAILRTLRSLCERGFALLTGRWRTLQHITASPSKIGDIARAALVLTHFEQGYIT